MSRAPSGKRGGDTPREAWHALRQVFFISPNKIGENSLVGAITGGLFAAIAMVLRRYFWRRPGTRDRLKFHSHSGNPP